MREIFRHYLNEIDIHFADLICRRAGKDDPELFYAAALASNCVFRGDICIDLHEISGRKLSEIIPDADSEEQDLLLPDFDSWIEYLNASPFVGKPGEFVPMIVDEKARLYLYRYWNYERIISDKINGMCISGTKDFNEDVLKSGLERLFPSDDSSPDMQRVAAIASVMNRFSIISGGPGTGKTSTVVRIVALLLEQAEHNGSKLRIAMCAPTGKAASRLTESVTFAIPKLDTTDIIKDKIPSDTKTIHRLLGYIKGSPVFRHNSENPLPYDVIIVDETSMVDLALMAKLVDALDRNASLILLGDRDQLASVESGMVMGDICDTGNEHKYSEHFKASLDRFTGFPVESGSDEPAIADSLTVLKKSYRFGAGSGIGELASAIRENNSSYALQVLSSEDYPDVSIETNINYNGIEHNLRPLVNENFRELSSDGTPEDRFKLLDNFRILCAMKNGPAGIINVNDCVRRILTRSGHIESNEMWYMGRPVMITRNDYNLNLFNGDIGVLTAADSGAMQVCFMDRESIRYVNPYKLGHCETVYAMTVHKSQGSEFDNILVILPDNINPVLSRELIYTAVTRASKSVTIWASEEIFTHAVSTTTARKTGLSDSLWE